MTNTITHPKDIYASLKSITSKEDTAVKVDVVTAHMDMIKQLEQ